MDISCREEIVEHNMIILRPFVTSMFFSRLGSLLRVDVKYAKGFPLKKGRYLFARFHNLK
jgi:hypothetical protein